MKRKIPLFIIIFVILNSIILFYILHKTESMGIEPIDFKKNPTIQTVSTKLVVAVDSLNKIYFNGHKIDINNIGIAIDSIKNTNSDIQNLVIVPHSNCSIDKLKIIAGFAIDRGLTVHVRN